MKQHHYQLLLSLLLLCCSVIAHAESYRMVLVTGTQKLDNVQLSEKEIRKIFLGQVITRDDKKITALINNTDPLLYQVFLQKVAYMSANAYERHLLSKVFRMGGNRPPVFVNNSSLVSALRSQAGTITYMWEETALKMPGVSIIGELWSGAIN